MKPEIIDKSREVICKKCEGKGCDVCTDGKYKDESYILITKSMNGEKIAFSTEYRGK